MEIWVKMEANQAKTRASASQPQKPEVCSSRNQHEKSAFPSASPPPPKLETTERLSWQRDYHLPLNFYCKRLARQTDKVRDLSMEGSGVCHVRNLCKFSRIYLRQCLHFGRWWRKTDRIVKEVGFSTNGARNLANNNDIECKRNTRADQTALAHKFPLICLASALSIYSRQKLYIIKEFGRKMSEIFESALTW